MNDTTRDKPITITERIEEITAPKLPESERAKTRANLLQMIGRAYGSDLHLVDLDRTLRSLPEGALARVAIILVEMVEDLKARLQERDNPIVKIEEVRGAR